MVQTTNFRKRWPGWRVRKKTIQVHTDLLLLNIILFTSILFSLAGGIITLLVLQIERTTFKNNIPYLTLGDDIKNQVTLGNLWFEELMGSNQANATRRTYAFNSPQSKFYDKVSTTTPHQNWKTLRTSAILRVNSSWKNHFRISSILLNLLRNATNFTKQPKRTH